MYVIRLPNGNLLVPESATAREGRLVSDAYVEIGPADHDYERLAAGALTQEEIDERAKRWREGDESLRRQFLDYLARGGPGGGRLGPVSGRPDAGAAGADAETGRAGPTGRRAAPSAATRHVQGRTATTGRMANAGVRPDG